MHPYPPARPGRGAIVWLLAVLVLLLAAHADLPAVARPASPHSAGRATPPPRGLSFTDGAGCRPRGDWIRVDSRVRTLLRGVAKRHRIRVSCLHTGHSRFVHGTRRVSNHTVWRAVDIDMVDGRPVSRRNLTAARLAVSIGQGRLGVQPSEVGSPWSFGRRPWFSDAGHQDHLHVGFRGR